MTWLRRLCDLLTAALSAAARDDYEEREPASLDELRRALERQIAADEKREARRG